MRFFAVCSILVLFSACSSMPQKKVKPQSLGPMTQEERDEVFLTAQLYIFSGDMITAQKTLNQALKRSSKKESTLDFQLMLARVETELGQVEKAYTRYTKLVTENEKNEAVLREAAQFLYSIRLKEDAFLLYSKLAKINPEESNYWIYRGLLALELANAKDAWDSFDYLIVKSKDAKHLGHLYMGKLMQMTGFPKKANKEFSKCLRQDPETKECLLELARNRYEKGQSSRAIASIDGYLKKYKTRGNKDLVEQLIDWYIEEGEFSKALFQVENLERLYPSDIEIKRRAAMLMIKDKDYEGALGRTEVVVEHKSATETDQLNHIRILRVLNRLPEAKKQLAKIAMGTKSGEKIFFELYKQNKKALGPKQALRELIKTCKNSKKIADCYYVTSFVSWESGDVDAALKLIKKGVKYTRNSPPKEAQLKFFLSQLYYDLKKPKKALRIVENILKKEEGYAPALNFKAYYLAEREEDLDYAERLSLRAVAQKPNNGHYMDTYGWILFKKGDLATALAVLKEAVRLNPLEPEILEHLADAYVEADDLKTAMKFYVLASELYKGENQNRVGGKIAQIRTDKKKTENSKKRSISSIPADAPTPSD